MERATAATGTTAAARESRAQKHNNAARVFGYDVFISFALGPPPRGTHSYASDLARRLRERDLTVFFSEDEASPGERLDSTLLKALLRSRTLVVIANRGTLEEPRWVRTEVEEFRSRHPDRPIIPISVDGALQDATLAEQTRQWLAFQDKIWLDESQDAVAQGIATEELVTRLAMAPTGRSSNAKWRWVVRAVVAGLIVLAAVATGFGLYARKQSREAKRQQGIAEGNAAEAKRQREEAERQANAATAQSAALTSLASNNDPARGLLLAHEALQRSDGNPIVTTVAALRNAVFRFGPAPLLEAGRRGLPIYDVVDGYAPFREQIVKAVNVSANGRWLIASVEDVSIHEIWRLDLEDKDPASTMRTVDIGLIDSTTNDEIATLAISRSGRRIAAVQDRYGPGVYVFNLNTNGSYRAQTAKWPEERPDRVTCLFSDNDQFLLCGKYLWRLDGQADKTEATVLSSEDRNASAFFSRDSKLVGLGTAQGNRFKVTTWQIPGATDMHERWFPSDVAASMSFPGLALPGRRDDEAREIHSADGRWKIAWSRRRIDSQFTTTTPAVVSQYDGAGNRKHEWIVPPEQANGNGKNKDDDAGAVQDAAFSGDGRRLVTIGKTLLVWDLTASEPFARPLVNLSTEGNHVAIDDSARWIASFGSQLQLWDLSLEVPAAFPINGTSLLQKAVSIDPEDVELRFAAAGKWLLVTSHDIGEEFTEFWDLRFENPEGDGKLARRNLSEAEWRSFFGRAPYRKTFPDQPTSAEAMIAAETLARAGRVTEAVEAYRQIVVSEPAVKLEPERRAARLGAAFYWEKGDQEASLGKYASGLKLLRQAKEMNPAIPWDAEARAGQLGARQWERIIRQLGAPRESSDPRSINAGELLGKLKSLLLRYPEAKFDASEHNLNLPPGSGLYEYGLWQLADRTRATAKAGDFDEALRLRAVLVRERGADLPSEDELRQLSTEGLSAQFQASLVSGSFVGARTVIQQATAIDGDLSRRMQAALEVVEAFEVLNRATRSGDVDKIISKTPNFAKTVKKVLGQRDAAATLAVIDPQVLNSMCWNGATQYGLAKLVLPICEEAVARDDKPEYRDSRGFAYAVVGSFDAAISDFNVFLTKGYPNAAEKESRSKWIEALTKCKSDVTACKNPFADPAFLRSIP